METECELKVGESRVLKRTVFTSTSIIFAGMLNDSVFSVVISYTSGNNSLAYNLYLPVSQKTLDVAKRTITIYSVSRYSMRMKYA